MVTCPVYLCEWLPLRVDVFGGARHILGFCTGVAQYNRLIIQSFRLLYHVLYLVALLDDLFHVPVAVVEVSFRLGALISFGLDLNELHAVLFLLGAQLLFLKCCFELLNFAFCCKVRLPLVVGLF
jgi:hypothetical protein